VSRTAEADAVEAFAHRRRPPRNGTECDGVNAPCLHGRCHGIAKKASRSAAQKHDVPQTRHRRTVPPFVLSRGSTPAAASQKHVDARLQSAWVGVQHLKVVFEDEDRERIAFLKAAYELVGVQQVLRAVHHALLGAVAEPSILDHEGLLREAFLRAIVAIASSKSYDISFDWGEGQDCRGVSTERSHRVASVPFHLLLPKRFTR
jgi:hypothetical protein